MEKIGIDINGLKQKAASRMEKAAQGAAVQSLEADETLAEYRKALYELRRDGEVRLAEVNEKITAARKNKMITDAERQRIIAECKEQAAKARDVMKEVASDDKALTQDAVALANALSKNIIERVNKEQDARIASLKADYAKETEKIKADASTKIAAARDKAAQASAKYELKSNLFDAQNRFSTEIGRCKDAKAQAFIDHVTENRALRGGRSNVREDMEMQAKNYVYNFKLNKFMLDNGLYLAIILFFIVCIIIAPLSGAGNLLSLPNIFTILEQSSTRMFYALGVAGLILIAGTDLSVGRMVAMGAVVTGLILHPGENIVKFFNAGPWDFTGLPMGVRLAMALFISIFCCVAFSMFAGFFSARLKIHPFISTLATQLIIYGLLFFGTTGTPVGSIDGSVKDLIGGRWELGYIGEDFVTLPKLIIPAIIAIIVAWFIWNKTVFGKNMYAVGGNAEAAAVSGINVFWVTMGIFIMAGIFYGCGSFLEAFRANASAGTGQGYELDAIAACVVGGISFNGGIGKISGAVIGVIIFTGLTYCLTYLHIDTNLQFVFKGFIIIAAVALDSIKYLKRK